MTKNLDAMPLRRPRGILNALLAAFVVGLCTFLAGAAVESVTHSFFPRTTFSTLADDFVIGVAAGVLVFVYEHQRNRYLLQRLKIVAEMNHHVRNALQVVAYSASEQRDEKLGQMLRESTERIEWALREVLEGRTTL